MKLEMTQYQEVSINELFKEYFESTYHETIIALDEKLSLAKNIEVLCKRNGKGFRTKTYEALKYAYDIKYGNWEEVNDLRELCGMEWCKPLHEIFTSLDNTNKIIDIGCNDGREVKDLLGDKIGAPQITLLDISEKAINRIKEIFNDYKNIEIKNESFQLARISNDKFDVCISLRTIHSSGINIHKSIRKCINITRPGGVIIFSVSNGYIDYENNEPLKGMYDPSSGQIDICKPFIIANDIKKQMHDFGLINIQIVEGCSEIFIIANK